VILSVLQIEFPTESVHFICDVFANEVAVQILKKRLGSSVSEARKHLEAETFSDENFAEILGQVTRRPLTREETNQIRTNNAKIRRKMKGKGLKTKYFFPLLICHK